MKTYSNDTTEVFASDSYERVGIGLHDKATPDARARYAMDLLKYVIVPGMLDGHSSARRMTADEVAAMACDTADAAFNAFRARGWMIDVPSMEVLKEEARENRSRN